MPYQTPQELFALVNIIYIMLVMVEYVFVLTFPDFSKKVSFKAFKTQLSHVSDLASVHPVLCVVA